MEGSTCVPKYVLPVDLSSLPLCPPTLALQAGMCSLLLITFSEDPSFSFTFTAALPTRGEGLPPSPGLVWEGPQLLLPKRN